MSRSLRVLVVEDSEPDTLLLLRELRKAGYTPSHRRVDTAEAMRRALEQQVWDLVIADHSMPQFSAPEALKILQEENLDLPFIILSGNMSQELAVTAMKGGAHDFITKGATARLIPAIERELRDAKDRWERRQAEAELRKLSRAVEHSTSVVIITDLQGQIEYVNPQFAQVTGYSIAEVLGQNIRLLQAEEEATEVYERLRETVQTGGEWHGELLSRRKNGEVYWAYSSISPILDEQGVITHYVVVKEDITELKKAEAAVRASEARYRCLVEASPNIIALISLDRRLEMINCYGVEVLGYQNEAQVRGRPPEEFVRGEDRERVQGVLDEVLRRGRVEHFQVVLKRADQSEVVVELSGSVLRDERQQPVSILVVGGDISSRKQAEEALRKANRELEAMNRQLAAASERSQRLAQAALVANQTKNQFLANVSHEIRTPMSGILVTINLLQETLLSPEQREYVQTLDHSARILLNIINDILDFSKLEAGKMELETIDYDLRETLQTLLRVLTVQANAKGLGLSCRFDTPIPPNMRGDPVRLRQIVINLVNNAIKFTEKGEIRMVVRVVDEEWVAQVLAQRARLGSVPGDTDFLRRAERGSGLGELRKCWIYFSVQDTGIGIPPNKLTSIFEAFTQADSSTTRRYGGTGLGLTIAARLVTLMGGRIWVESVLGEGSTFHLVVGFGVSEAPRPAEIGVPPRVSGLPAPVVLPPLRILLVEDNRINQRTVRRLLEKRGHTVVVAENGEVALQCLDREQEGFDLALMDVHMPTLDGYAATSAIRGREHSTGRHLPIIAMTANAMKGDEDRCLAAGMDGYISKPIQVPELLTVIARVISKDAPLLTSRAASISAQLVFDPEQALAQVEGDEAELRFLIGMFLEEEPRAMNTIREAIAGKDRGTLRLAVHNLKGMVSSLGGHLATEAADQLEQLCDREGAIALEPALQRLTQEMDRLVAVLENLEAGKPL